MNTPRGELEVERLKDPVLLGRAGYALAAHDGYFREVLNALPAAIYITDADGLIIYYNTAAGELWGHSPPLGTSQWCGSWKLFCPDGTPLPHDQCPMAVALKERRPIRGVEAVAERPDGVRAPFMPYPTPFFDESGALLGAINMLVDMTGLRRAEDDARLLASVVETSDDAIVTKNLDGIITSWNRGAQRIFGYTAEETIGKSITILIPDHLQDEEPQILARIRAGQRIDHYETIRRRKDGTLLNVSLTISPLKNSHGVIVGASKIARDITEQRRAQEQQELLVREMNHRIKNVFSLASGVVNLSARSAGTPQELAAAVRDRLAALARAHDLTLLKTPDGAIGDHPATLHALIRTIVSPYEEQTGEAGERVRIRGADAALSAPSVTSLALLLHEFATNAAKYGALSMPGGAVDVECAEEGDHLILTWTESGGPRVEKAAEGEGFGSLLARTAVKGQLDGDIARDWRPEGLVIRLSVSRNRL